MKHIKRILMAVVVLAAMLVFMAVTAMAQVEPWVNYSTGGTDVGTTLCYSVLSANGVNRAAPNVTYLNATSDKSTSVVQFYTVENPVQETHTNSTVTLYVAQTNGFSSGDVVVLRHTTTDTYERRVLTTMTTATNLVLTAAPTVAMIPGDLVYRATTAGSIPVGNATKELTGGGIYSGQPGKPLLLEVDGTSACQINAVSANYPKP